MYVEFVPCVSKVITGKPAFVHKYCADKLMIALFIKVSSLIFQPFSYEDPFEDMTTIL
jgi:hypothetical protein